MVDIALIRTFLEVVNAGSFIKAAERLHVTQTAVTARIRSLEHALGSSLFIRNRAGARLTPEGENFLPHATDINNTWNHARRSVALPEGHQFWLRIGSETSLWNPLLVHWIAWLQAEMPQVAVDSRIAEQTQLIHALERGQLDAAIVHAPSYYAGFAVEELLEEKLIRVQSPISRAPDLYIDWGREFERQYKAMAASPAQCAYSFDLGPAALQFMLQAGGNGWFRTRVVRPYLETGKLLRIADAPEFTYPVYLTYRAGEAKPVLQQALVGLRQLASLDTPWSL